MNIYPAGNGNRRRQAILALVDQGGVRSQEDLQRRLKRRGIEVAQPTLSRDLKALGLAKNPSGYVSANAGVFVSAEAREGALARAVGEFVLSVRAAASLAVVRPRPARAPRAPPPPRRRPSPRPRPRRGRPARRGRHHRGRRHRLRGHPRPHGRPAAPATASHAPRAPPPPARGAPPVRPRAPPRAR